MRRVWSRRTLWLAGLFLTSSFLSRAEVLPVRTYTAADGLPRDAVTFIKQDSHGFIWMIASDGISRFDGYKFTNYTTDDGLADRRVNDLLETRNGVYWVATEAGLCRFNPLGRPQSMRGESDAGRVKVEPMFTLYNPDAGKAIAFHALAEDENGAIWCGTDRGLFRLDAMLDGKEQFHSIDLGMPEAAAEKSVTVIFKDSKGALWLGTEGASLYQLLPNGRVERYSHKDGLPLAEVASLFEEPAGNIWIGTRKGLSRLVAVPGAARAVVVQTYGEKDGLEARWVNTLLRTHDGKLWAATNAGLYWISLTNGASAPRFQHYDARNGLCDYDVWNLTEDRDGNLWVASVCGAQKIQRNGFTGYDLADGLGAPYINSIFENHDGMLLVINAPASDRRAGYAGRIINQFDGTHFHSVEPNVLKTDHSWGWGQTVLQDHLGEWWVPTARGLYRFPQVERVEQLKQARARLVRTAGDGQAEPEIFRVYEEGRGDVWIATTGTSRRLLRWERATDSIHDLTQAAGTPPNTDFTRFCEDRAGNLWIGTGQEGGLLRYERPKWDAPLGTSKSAGVFKRFTVEDGLPPGWIISLYLDRLGRLWIGSQLGGLNRIDDTTANTPHFVRYTTAEGLSSNNIRAITEDLWGRLYVGTGHGVDRLDSATGIVKHYTAADGLPKGGVETAYRDRGGALWFGSLFGLARFLPEQSESSAPPSIFITGLRVEGVARRISELGETTLPKFKLTSDQNELSVDFVGLGANLGEELHYQYRLEGTDNDWSAPSAARTVNFASLTSGTYSFMVRAVNADGKHSLIPASFTFTILSPIWMRWWFWSLVAAALGLATYVLYRYRLTRLLELANMRTRIATDLHDDIGANLTKIAILSEVARQQLGDDDAEQDRPLSSIARISRESVAAMSDIVWAINPHRDNLRDLVRRMRQHAEEVCLPQNIEVVFGAPGHASHSRLGVDIRRDIYLIFKEAVTNAVRHSDCTRLDVDLVQEKEGLVLTITDNGKGFDPGVEVDGNGLINMRRRAERHGGGFEIDSRVGRGTTIKARLHLARSRPLTPT